MTNKHRYFILAVLIISAAVLYITGFKIESGFLVAGGALLEIAFWIGLFKTPDATKDKR